MHNTHPMLWKLFLCKNVRIIYTKIGYFDQKVNYSTDQVVKFSREIDRHLPVTLINILQEPVSSSNDDFESLVLRKMRQAEERKRLIEQMKDQDGDS